MNNCKLSVKFKKSEIKRLEKTAQDALFETAEELHKEVVKAKVMPYDTGNMQNETTSVQKINADHVQLVTEAPYASRVYYHPEYNFQKEKNPAAQGRWLDRWIYGSESDWCQKTFAKIFKRLGGF